MHDAFHIHNGFESSVLFYRHVLVIDQREREERGEKGRGKNRQLPVVVFSGIGKVGLALSRILK